MAILLKRELAHLVAGWDVTILGTDINRQCLTQAREGRFEEWAFRSTPEELKHDCFSKEGNFWNIAPKYKEGVSFRIPQPGGALLPLAGQQSLRFRLDCLPQRDDLFRAGRHAEDGPAVPRMPGPGRMAVGGPSGAEHDVFHLIPYGECTRRDSLSESGHGSSE